MLSAIDYKQLADASGIEKLIHCLDQNNIQPCNVILGVNMPNHCWLRLQRK